MTEGALDGASRHVPGEAPDDGRSRAARVDVVSQAIGAVARRDWSRLRFLLHPYIRWTSVDGRTTRGRNNVLTRLESAGSVGPPAEHELRDGQIYRWVESRGGPEASGQERHVASSET